jgi:CheY-like chemotaxis protein
MLVLPALASVPARKVETEEKLVPTGGSERILVVEDDPAVLQSVTRELTALGYEVEAATNGPDALDLLKRERRFDLLFADVMLPKGITGVSLAKQARAIDPGLKVLLTSGYPEEVFERQGRPDEGNLVLRKPYRRKELAETLRRAMAGGRNQAGGGLFDPQTR